MVVAVLMFALVLGLISRPSRAGPGRRSGRALAAVNVWFYKLWAFALASFITGVAGGVLAVLSSTTLYSIGFPTQDSITLLAVTLMGGVFSLWGAVIAGFLSQFLPALLNNWGVSADWLIILFGRCQVAGPQDLARLRLLGRRLRRRPRRWSMIEVDGPTVRYGGVTSLYSCMKLYVRAGDVRAHRAERAGKTTFFNVLSGFVWPGVVRAFGVDLLFQHGPCSCRARWGCAGRSRPNRPSRSCPCSTTFPWCTSTPGLAAPPPR